MTVTVRVPTQLRALTEGASEVEVPPGSVRELIDSLNGRYAGLAMRLVDEKGALRRFVNVFVGDEDVRFLQGLDTKVADGATVSIIPAVAGGS